MSFKKTSLTVTSIAALIVVIAMAGWFAYQSNFKMHVSENSLFSGMSVAIRDNNIIDIGVVDYNDDDILDIFTVNHHSQQSILKGTGNGRYVDDLLDLKMNAQLNTPGIEIWDSPPSIDMAGLYIYWQNYGLVLDWIPGSNSKTPNGTVELQSKVEINKQTSFEYELTDSIQPGKISKSIIRFSARSRDRFIISPEFLAVPISIELAESTNLKTVYLGQQLLNPEQHNFTLFLNDRHGMAWSDYNQDNEMDVFISRGGLKGKMDKFSDEYFDELLEKSDNGYRNVIKESGIKKHNCPGYNVQWVDYDSDDDLDLYITCHHGYKNRLFSNNGDGYFVDVAPLVGLDFSNKLTDTPFFWFDLNDDGYQDLFIADENDIVFLKQLNNRFEQADIFPAKGISKMSPADFDNDGDIDILLASHSNESAMLINNDMSMTLARATEFGLPEFMLTANWVDYDNDGLTDLHVVPGGLFRGYENGKFQATDLLKHKFPQSVKRARNSWFDIDNDGDLDLLLAINYENSDWRIVTHRLLGDFTPAWIKPQKRIWKWNVRVFHNNTDKTINPNNWLQIKLVGSKSNPQAIGAHIEFYSNSKKFIAHVGQFEGSLLSQGHFRLYFGLGDIGEINNFVVFWPDGSKSKHSIKQINTLVEIKKPA